MKKYTFEVIVYQGSDHFWDDIKGTGCDEILEAIQEELETYDAEVKLIKFEDQS